MGLYKLLLFGLSIAISTTSFASAEISYSWSLIQEKIAAKYPAIPRAALDRAFSYLSANEERVKNKDYLTIIDFDLPSTAERMYVIDLHTEEAKTYLVAHGSGSGGNYATRFSNRPDSKMSSLGVYLTGEEYIGSHGLSMILRGQEPTNSNAESRSIVMHSAEYVSYEFIRQRGRLGRSWGCPAVNPAISDELVRKLENGSVFLIYHSPIQRGRSVSF